MDPFSELKTQIHFDVLFFNFSAFDQNLADPKNGLQNEHVLSLGSPTTLKVN